MKKLLLLAALVWQAHGATIIGNLRELVGTDRERPLTAEFISVLTGESYPITPEEGKVWIVMPAGEYLLKVGQLTWKIRLADEETTYSLLDLIRSAASVTPTSRYPIPTIHVSPTDPIEGFLSWKIRPGTGVTFSTNNIGTNEWLTVNAIASTNAPPPVTNAPPSSIVFNPAQFGTNAAGQVEIKRGIDFFVNSIRSADGKELWDHKSAAENPGANNVVRFTDLPEDQVTPCSDQTTRIIAGHTYTWPVSRTYNILWARAVLVNGQNAGTSPVFTVDLRKNGTSIMKTRLTIDNGETDSMNAAIQAELISTNVPVTYKDMMTAVVTQVGEGNPAGLFIITYGER